MVHNVYYIALHDHHRRGLELIVMVKQARATGYMT